MKVFKFGGATVKSAEAVRKVKAILDKHRDEELVVVISAMGKTTNALEKITQALYERNEEGFSELVNQLYLYHYQIIDELFNNKRYPIYEEIEQVFKGILDKYDERISENYNYLYDQIVPIGEQVSTRIVSDYLHKKGLSVKWRDARTFIRTDNQYRKSNVDWPKTAELVKKELIFDAEKILVTQGFVGHTVEGFSTTLGREGSDFTAAIIAYCLDAESVTIWKDVAGMYNADPRYFKDVIKLDRISYKEVIELSYYGASVIHPKTVQPLKNKDIPLYIRSFEEPGNPGTVVQKHTDRDSLVPSFIFKPGQILLSITTKDFAFVVEENLSDIFKKLSLAGAHINVMQNSAVSFTVCMEIDEIGMQELLKLLNEDYKVRYNTGLELVTIRHYDQETINRIISGKRVLMEQRTRETVRLVISNEE